MNELQYHFKRTKASSGTNKVHYETHCKTCKPFRTHFITQEQLRKQNPLILPCTAAFIHISLQGKVKKRDTHGMISVHQRGNEPESSSFLSLLRVIHLECVELITTQSELHSSASYQTHHVVNLRIKSTGTE